MIGFLVTLLHAKLISWAVRNCDGHCLYISGRDIGLFLFCLIVFENGIVTPPSSTRKEGYMYLLHPF